jgi:regulatory protein
MAKMRRKRAKRVAEGSLAPTGSARPAAVTLLSRRDYTAAEIRERLADKGFAAEDIDTAVRDLETAGAIDDRRVAAAHVRTAIGVKGRGRRRIEQELMARGVSRDVARAALAESSPDDEAAAIARFLARRRLPVRLDEGARRRLVQQLLRRGFSMGAITEGLRAQAAGYEPDYEPNR